MGRKNIFEVLKANNGIEEDVERIEHLFSSEPLLNDNRNYRNQDYTLKKFVDYFCFDDWKNRGHCIDMEDFLKTVDYRAYCRRAKLGDIDAFFGFVEIVFNCWKRAELYINAEDNIDYYSNFYHLYDIMVDCLSHYNYTAVYDESTEQVLVIEDNPAITAVAEIAEPQLSLNVLKYNHYTLRGNIDKKKSILLALGAGLEPKRKILAGINSTLEDGVFFMLNSLNIRHNNLSPGNKHYKEFVSQMSNETLESWYDELYQMVLLAFLELDQIERNSKVKALKANINGGTT